jgi:hypothetical protein
VSEIASLSYKATAGGWTDPLEKIKLSVLERLALTSIYKMAKLTGRQAQITVMAKKTQ